MPGHFSAMLPPSTMSGALGTWNGPSTVVGVAPLASRLFNASTSMLTPITSENRMNSWRLSSHFLPMRVRKSIPVAHSAWVGSTSRTNAWMCLMKDCITWRSRGSGTACQRSRTTSVRFCSVTYGIRFSVKLQSVVPSPDERSEIRGGPSRICAALQCRLPHLFLVAPDFLPHDARAVHHGLHLTVCDCARQVLHAAVRRDREPLRRHMREDRADATGHDIGRFDGRVGEVDHSQYDGL